MAKDIAATIKKMCSSETTARVLDRGASIDGIAEELLEHWSYDLYTRSPGPAFFENGVLSPTDLDLACFLSALVDRHAVINLPRYQGRRPKTTREGERVVSAANRHGKVLGLSANKEVFSFSIRVEDQNVIQAATATKSDQIGAPRNFMLVDIDGTWHDGWGKIEFMPTAKENDFLKDKKLWTGSEVVFKNFVHPNRWISFYGQYYLLTKLLIERLEEQNKHARQEEKRLLAAGCAFPLKGEGAKEEWVKATMGESMTEKVAAFECEVDAPWTGEFGTLEKTDTALVSNAARIKELQYQVLPRLRFATRATELAFYQAGMKGCAFPAWIKGAAWESGYVAPGKRTAWERLMLAQNLPGQKGFALRYRTYEKTERVAAT